MIFNIVIAVCLFPTIFAEEKPKLAMDHHHHRSEIVSNLLKSYDRVIRPGGDQAVTVNVSMFIMHMEWAKNELCMTAFIRHAWTDSRLTSPEAGNHLMLNADEILPLIWKPDTFIPEAIDKQIMEHGFVRIDGHKLLMSQMWKLKIPCRGSIAVLYTHNGHMTCKFSFESYFNLEKDLVYAWHEQGTKPVSWNKEMDTGLNITEIRTEVSSLTWVGGKYSKLNVSVEFRTPFGKAVFDYLSSDSIQKVA